LRPRLVVAVAALIAAGALVAQAGPVGSSQPDPARIVDVAALQPLAIPVASSRAMTTLELDPANASLGRLEPDGVFVDGATAPGVPNARVQVDLPAPQISSIVKPVPRPVVHRDSKPAARATTTRRTTTSPRRAPSQPVRRAPVSSGGSFIRDPEVSWYGPGFYGHRTACGQTLTKGLLGVAHKTLPCGTRVTFRNPSNGRTITVRVVDRGPYVAGRQWDLTGGTCVALDHCYTGPILYRIG